MFNFLKPKLISTPVNPEADALVEEFAGQESRHYSHKLENFTAGIKYKNADPQSQRDVVMAMISWFERNPRTKYDPRDIKDWQTQWKMRQLFLNMLKSKLPFSEQDVLAILNWSLNRTENHTYYYAIPQMIKVMGDYLKENTLGDNVEKSINALIGVIEAQNATVEARRW